MTKNKLILLAVIIPFSLIGIGYTIWNINNQTYSSFIAGNPINDNGSDEMAVSAIVGPGVEIIKTKTGTVTVETKNYGDAINIYGKSGYRFQFSNCSGNPGMFTIKIGTKFMIDNRDNTPHQISIGAKTYKLAAYDFAIVSIQKAGNYNITCDGGGAATVLVQN